jgi:hypothetical protein
MSGMLRRFVIVISWLIAATCFAQESALTHAEDQARTVSGESRLGFDHEFNQGWDFGWQVGIVQYG